VSTQQSEGHHGIRNARHYGTSGFDPLLRNHDIWDGRGIFKAISSVGQAEADELVKTSIEGGINFFDTADNYTEGESEKILGQSLLDSSPSAQSERMTHKSGRNLRSRLTNIHQNS
jgi:hypothetical protein